MDKEHSISQNAKKWLNSFSDQVDFGRFQRGILLFDKEHLLEIDITPIGFRAVILGSNKSRYNVMGEFILDGYFPDIKTLQVSCNCPDDAPICKHGICAVCYLIPHFEMLAKQKQRVSISKLEIDKCEEVLELFKKSIDANEVNVLNLPDENFWPFESSFNEAMNDIDFVIDGLLKELKNRL